MKLTNPKTGQAIESPFTAHADAAAALRKRVAEGEFTNPGFAPRPIDAASSFGIQRRRIISLQPPVQ